jgi:hypothetical protein
MDKRGKLKFYELAASHLAAAEVDGTPRAYLKSTVTRASVSGLVPASWGCLVSFKPVEPLVTIWLFKW